ncbi:MAG: molybdopterin-binding protein [Spirochaetes bacterium]|nr:molybdopterin-binding protein [Spirochaetota bacterium]
MKKIQTENAVGHILCHDQTQITENAGGGVLFKKGHIVREEDIEKLLAAGKSHIYIYQAGQDMVHEDDAAGLLYAACAANNMKPTPVREGKIEIIAEEGGLLKVDTQRLAAVHDLGNIVIATRRNNTVIKKGDKLAGMRVIPLVIEKSVLDEVKKISDDRPLLEIKPFHKFNVGLVITGSEIHSGRIKDGFTAVIEQKLAAYNLKIDCRKVADDDALSIKSAIEQCLEAGANLILCTGGMSVDPDDITPSAIRAAGASILSYGAPVLPGSMLLLGYMETGAAIFGIPACAMYAKTTSFDLLFPRVLAKDTITKKEIASLGHGGLCLKCPACSFPNCEFGKG